MKKDLKDLPEIETERFFLRKVNENDNLNIFNILSDKSVIENLNMEIHKNIENTNEMIEDYLEGLKKGEKYPFAIIDKSSKEFIGVFLTKLDIFDEDSFEFTVYIKKSFGTKESIQKF